MKIVIISDLHSNAEALAALTESYDELRVLGDLVNYGPQPQEVIAAVRDRAALVVRGNHGHAVGYDADAQCAPAFRAMAAATQRYTASVLPAADKDFLRELSLTLTVTRDERRVYLCHATPSDPLFAYCPPDSPQWEQEADRVDADVILVGHTHLPFVKAIGKCQIVNPGSLGQQKHGGPHASYAVWENGEVSLRTVPYPVRTDDRATEATPTRDRCRRGGRPPSADG